MNRQKIWYCVNCGYEIGHRGKCHRCHARLVSSPLTALPVLEEDEEVAYRLGGWAEKARGRLIVALIRANVEHRFDDEELVVDVNDEAKVDDLLEELQAVLAGEGVEVVVEDEDEDEDEDDDEDEDEDDDDVDNEDDDDDDKALDGNVEDDTLDGDGGDLDDDDGPGAVGEDDEDLALGDKVAVTAGDAASTPTGLAPEPLDATQAAIELLYDAARRLRTDPTDMQADGDVAEASAGVFADDDLIGIDPDTWAAIGRVTRRLLGALGAEEALDDEIRTQAGVLAKLLQPYVEPDPAEEVVAAPSTTAELLAESTAAVPEGRFDPGRGFEDDDAQLDDNEPGDDGALAPESDEAVVEAPLLDEPVDDAVLVGESDDRADDDVSAEPSAGSDAGHGPAEADDEDDDEDDGDEVVDGLVDDDDAQIVYELAEWLPEQRANLSVMLDEDRIEHSWDGGDLVIPGTMESAVDAIFDRIEAQDSVDDEGEERYRAMEDLFSAADRLAGDPDSESRRADLLAATHATDGPAPLGMPDTLWWQIRARARTLTDALDTGAADSRVREDAAALRDLLRSVV